MLKAAGKAEANEKGEGKGKKQAQDNVPSQQKETLTSDPTASTMMSFLVST